VTLKNLQDRRYTLNVNPANSGMEAVPIKSSVPGVTSRKDAPCLSPVIAAARLEDKMMRS